MADGAAHGIADVVLDVLEPLSDAIGYYHLLAILVSVVVLLGSFYLRPIRTKRQLAVFLSIVFALLAVCSMTLWFLLKAALKGEA